MSLTKEDHWCGTGVAADAGNTAACGCRSNFGKRFSNIAEWLIPGAILFIMPKCPLCIVGYVAVATGIGLSFSTAATARILILAVCTIALTFVAAKYIYRLRNIRF